MGEAGIIRPRGVRVVNRRLVLWTGALLLIAGFSALGHWQLQRGAQKEGMLARASAVLRERRALSFSTAELRDPRGYDWVAGHARVQASPVLLLDNQRRGDQVGVRVLAVLKPREGRPLLADFGWLPLPADRRLPTLKLPQGELALAGLLAPPPGAGFPIGPAMSTTAAPQDGVSTSLLTRVDIPYLARQLGLPLAPRVLRLDPALRLGYARDLEVLPNTLPPERHRGYALQWFGLAFATLCTALFMHFRRPPP
jgi:cytochrome oxidase assembly protein ShyY1